MSGATSRPILGGFLPVLLVLLVSALLPLVLSSGFHLRLAMLIWVYAALCMGFNLLYGFTGQISLGQQAFFAIGAYAFALLQDRLGWAPLPALAGSIVISAAIGLAMGLPLLRLRTHYLAMATLAFGLILLGLLNRWSDFTGGTVGLAVAPLQFGGHPVTVTGVFYIVLAGAALLLLLHDFVIRSHLGRALQAIRDDDTAAAALGVHVTRYKLRMFVLAAVMAAIGGIGFSIVGLRIDPSMTEFSTLVNVLTISVVGGLGTRFGPLVGAIIITLLPQFLVSLGNMETFVYGAFILIFLIFLPRGLAGLLEGGLRRRRSSGNA